MPDWYPVIVVARYAGMSAPEFLRLPIVWQQAYQVAHAAEIEAEDAEVRIEGS